jgi:acyl carrier protein
MHTTTWGESIRQQALRLLPDAVVPRIEHKPERPDFGLDTLDFVELLLQVEQHFDCRFSPAQLEDLRAVQLLLNSAARPHRRQLYAEFFAQLMQQRDWV